MHVPAPQPRDERIPVFCNIDASVGSNAQTSNSAGIALVQILIPMRILFHW